MNQIEKGWDELRNRCCADPTEAKRCVMVSRDDFAAAIAAMQPAPQEAVMQSDIVQRLRAASQGMRSHYKVGAVELIPTHTMDEAAAEITRLTEALRRNMTDHGRLIWKDEAESVCPNTNDCFEYGDTVRCGPCAIKLAENAGVAPNMQLPNLPEVSCLRRENASLTEALRAAEEREKAGQPPIWPIGHGVVMVAHAIEQGMPLFFMRAMPDDLAGKPGDKSTHDVWHETSNAPTVTLAFADIGAIESHISALQALADDARQALAGAKP